MPRQNRAEESAARCIGTAMDGSFALLNALLYIRSGHVPYIQWIPTYVAF